MEVVGCVGQHGGGRAVGAVDVEPESVLAADLGDLADRVDGAGAHGAGGAHHQHRPVSAGQVLGDLRPERVRPQALRGVGGDPADRVGAEAEEVARLLDPGVGSGGGVDPERRSRRREAAGPDPFAQHRPPAGQEADEVGHVAAAHQQPAAGLGIADQLGDPAHRLRLDLGRHRRELPPADVRVHGRGEQVGEHADRRGGRGDVAHEAGMAVEERMLEQQPGGLGKQRCGRGAAGRERAPAEQVPDFGGRLARGQGAVADTPEEFGQPVHQLVAESAEFVRRKLERYYSLRQWASAPVSAGRLGISEGGSSPVRASPDSADDTPRPGRTSRPERSR